MHVDVVGRGRRSVYRHTSAHVGKRKRETAAHAPHAGHPVPGLDVPGLIEAPRLRWGIGLSWRATRAPRGKDPTASEEMPMRFLFHDCTPEIARWALTTRRLMHAQRA